MFTVLLFVVSLVQSVVLGMHFHWCYVVGMRIRAVLVSAVYTKVCQPSLLVGCAF